MIRCIGSNILIKKEKEIQKPGSLIVPNKEKKNFFAIVESIGEKVELEIKLADKVLVNLYAGFVIESTDLVDYCIIRPEDIIGVEENV